MVLIRTMQQVAVKKQRIARLHFDVNQFHSLEHLADPLLIGAGLFPRQDVIDAAKVMRATDDLQATILPSGRVYGDKSTREQRGQDAILVPVAVVLVPCPCAADPCDLS